MSRTLRAKLRRDIVAQWPQFAAITVTMLLGVGLFAASYDAYQNLLASYDRVFAEQRFADLFVTGGEVEEFAADARTTAGVAAVSTRTQADLPLRFRADKLPGRVIGLPAQGQPAVNRVTVLRGSGLDGPASALVEHHTADHFGLRPGSTVRVYGRDGWVSLRVTGVVASGEYLWPARSRQDPIPVPDNFGVLFVPEPMARQLAGAGPNQALVRLTEPGDTRLDSLAARARDAGATDVYTRADQPSNSLLHEDIRGFGELSVMFPLLFLSAAGLAGYVLLTRRVRTERPVIGMLRACGMPRRKLLRHYLGYGLAAGLTGAVLGLAAGVPSARLLSRVYLEAISLPADSAVVGAVRADTVAAGLGFGIVAGIAAAWAPARMAARVPPAEAMRLAPEQPGGRSLLERVLPVARRLPPGGRLVLRGIERNRRRSAFTALSVVLALLLILISWTMIDTMEGMLRTQFDVVSRQDASVEFTGPARLDPLRELPGVTAVEPTVRTQVTVRAGGGDYATALQALPADTRMHGFRLVGGGTTRLPSDGVLLARGVTDRLGVRVGDTVTLILPLLGRTVTAPVRGVLDEPLGSFGYGSLDWLRDAVGEVSVTSALLRFAPEADRADLRRTISALDGVAGYEDSKALARMYRQYAGLFYAFVGGMLVLGALMAFAVVFTTMSVNVLERSRELATLRAAGVRHRTVARLVAAENLLVASLGVVPGLILGVVAGRLFLDSYSSDQFRLDLVVRPTTLLFSAVAVLAVAAASQWPSLRAVRRLEIATVVRERGG
ncbi:MAG: ABC transporter permease [Micromonosporaceae bacterium]